MPAFRTFFESMPLDLDFEAEAVCSNVPMAVTIYETASCKARW